MAKRSKKTAPPGKLLSPLWLVAFVVAVTALVRLPLINIPLERDEGEYAYIAWRLDYGEAPYRDWVDQKPPGIFCIYRAALGLPMPPVTAIHLVGLLWAAASACALFYLARRIVNGLSAALAAGVFAIVLADPAISGFTANTELFMLLPLLLSQLVFFHASEAKQRSLWLEALCGVLIGIAISFKQVAAVNWFLLVAIYPVFALPGRRLLGTIRFAAASAAGISVVWTLIASWFYFHGAFHDFVYQVLTHNLQYVSSLPAAERWENAKMAVARLRPAQLVIWILAGIALVLPRPLGGRKWWAFLIGWVLTSLIAVSASGYFFPHYFQQLLPPLCLAAVMATERVLQLRSITPARRRIALAATAALLLLPPAIAVYPYLATYSFAETLHRIYPANFFEVAPALGERLAQGTQPDDKVFVFGSEPELLFYARRASATRYIFLFPLYGPYSDALEKQKSVVDEVSTARPAAALYAPHALFFTPGTEQYLTRWSQEFLQKDYRRDAFVTRDKSRTMHLVNGNNGLPPIAPPGHGIQAMLLLRNN